MVAMVALPVNSHSIGPEHDPRTPDLVFFECRPDVVHLDSVVVRDPSMSGTSLQCQSIDDVFFLLLVQEASCLGAVRQDFPDHE
jgi:hypothetical protein